jgi:predicted nucleic acid-binding protein
VPSYFFDSSAIVKRYHFEAGSVWVRAICGPRAHPLLDLSEIALVEVIAALGRTERYEHLHPSFVDSTENTFRRHVARSDPAQPEPVYRLIPLSAAVLRLAASLCDRHRNAQPAALRSLDAIQLASALAIAPSAPSNLIFVTADIRLAAFASLEGLSTVNPLAPPNHP